MNNSGSVFLLLRMIRKNGGISPSRYGLLLLYMLKALLLFPGMCWERLFLSKKISSTPISHSPVFVIGHYRSGTTFLHKVLASDQQWGRITTFDFLFPFIPPLPGKWVKTTLQRIIDLFRVKHMHFNHYPIDLDDPLEEDMITIGSLSPSSAFWGEVFPKNAREYFEEQIFFRNDAEKNHWQDSYLYFLKKLTFRNKGKRLLLKNPPNTGRVGAILELFPDARFVYIYRNPYQVFFSTRSLWERTLEKYYTLQIITEREREEIILELYLKLMMQFEEDRSLIPEGNLVEVRYETFEANPYEEAKRIYSTLRLPGLSDAKTDILKRLEKEKSYQKYSYVYPGETLDRVYQHWGYFIDKWNYQRLDQ